jgi:5,10-methylene-tetrahydrofolate dehydrogenase/methenyl tetrahydrofolate cyclohydrolase
MYRLFLARVMKGARGLDLRGKTLIVTGASRGIGRALASELAQSNVNLVLKRTHAIYLDLDCVGAHVPKPRSLLGD